MGWKEVQKNTLKNSWLYKRLHRVRICLSISPLVHYLLTSEY